MPILGIRSFDAGAAMVNSADASDLTRVVADNAASRTGGWSLRIGGTTATWARWGLSGTPNNPAVSLWLYHFSIDDYNTTVLNRRMDLRFLLTTGEYIDLRWNGATHTFDAYVDNALVSAGTWEVSSWAWFHVQFS